MKGMSMLEEVTKVAEGTVSKKDFEWYINGTEYKILNIPYERIDAEGEEFVDLDVATKMEMLRELMVAERIPPVVDFEIVAEFELDF
jgi:hypothetical protein